MSNLKASASASVSSVQVVSSSYASHTDTHPLFCGGHASMPLSMFEPELNSGAQLWALFQQDDRRKAELEVVRRKSLFYRRPALISGIRVYSTREQERFDRHQMVQNRFKKVFRATVECTDPYADILDSASFYLSQASSLASRRSSLLSSSRTSGHSVV